MISNLVGFSSSTTLLTSWKKILLLCQKKNIFNITMYKPKIRPSELIFLNLKFFNEAT